jgi:hypothetical protein
MSLCSLSLENRSIFGHTPLSDVYRRVGEQSVSEGVRRRKNADGGRHIVYRVKVNDAENKVLCAKANAEKITVSRLLAESVLGQGDDRPVNRPKVVVSELLGIRRMLNSMQSGKPVAGDVNRKLSDILERLGHDFGTDR